MNRSEEGFAVVLPEGAGRDPRALACLKQLADTQRCSVLGADLPPIVSKVGVSAERKFATFLFKKDGGEHAFCIALDRKQGEVDCSHLPVNPMTVDELETLCSQL